MDQRIVDYPARSIDIRITEAQCGDGHFARGVAAALRELAQKVEEHDETGSTEIRMPCDVLVFSDLHRSARIETHERIFTVEWSNANKGENHA